jgi:hypothetical protein
MMLKELAKYLVLFIIGGVIGGLIGYFAIPKPLPASTTEHGVINFAAVNDSTFSNDTKAVSELLDENGCTMNNSKPSECLDTCNKMPQCKGVFAYNAKATGPGTKGRCCFKSSFGSVTPIDKTSRWQGDTYIKTMLPLQSFEI